MTNLEKYQMFVGLHSNTKEQYDPTPGNVLRWEWHINQVREKGVPVESVTQAYLDEMLVFAKSRSFKDINKMPCYMRQWVQHAAAFFPERQVWACGSRVTGEYVDERSGDSIRTMRAVLGKPEKRASDYDIFIDISDGGMPERLKRRVAEIHWLDVLFFGVPEQEKIIIPMWDFSKLPNFEHAHVVHFFNEKNWAALRRIHDKYAISENVYCCDDGPIIRHFKYAIEAGKIKAG